MLHRDYLMDIIQNFVNTVLNCLRSALLERDVHSCVEVEQAVGELLDLDAASAMALSPESLVTMMQLSGVGDSVASYVAYSLNRVGDAYQRNGYDTLAKTRHEQASAVAVAFGWSLSQVPEEFQDLEAELKA